MIARKCRLRELGKSAYKRFAALRGQDAVVELLLHTRLKPPINANSFLDWSKFLFVARYGHLSTLQLLLDQA